MSVASLGMLPPQNDGGLRMTVAEPQSVREEHQLPGAAESTWASHKKKGRATPCDGPTFYHDFNCGCDLATSANQHAQSTHRE